MGCKKKKERQSPIVSSLSFSFSQKGSLLFFQVLYQKPMAVLPLSLILFPPSLSWDLLHSRDKPVSSFLLNAQDVEMVYENRKKKYTLRADFLLNAQDMEMVYENRKKTFRAG